MTWLAWRQFRVNVAVALGTLLAVAIVLGFTDPHSTGGYLNHHHLVQFLSTALVGVPAILGAFWGAPLVARELETGTFRLAWTQGVTRSRWLVVKVGLIGLVTVVVTGLLTLMLTGWAGAAVNIDRFSSAMFGQRGIAPMGYALFAFVLGVTLGAVVRRTVPAMALTLVAFLAVRLVVTNLLRPHFAKAITLSRSLAGQRDSFVLQAKPGDWVVSNHDVSLTGHVTNDLVCPGGRGGREPSGVVHAANNAVQQCVAQYRQVLTYQPAGRYWRFQTYETLIFVGLALVLLGVCAWWVRRRLT